MRPPTSIFMHSPGNCRVLMLQKTQPPLRGKKRFISEDKLSEHKLMFSCVAALHKKGNWLITEN